MARRWTEADVRALESRRRGDVLATPAKAPPMRELEPIPMGRAFFSLPLPPSKNDRHGYNILTGEVYNKIEVREFFDWCRMALQEQKRASIFDGQYPLTCRVHADVTIFVPETWAGDTHNVEEILFDGLEKAQIVENDRLIRTHTLYDSIIAEGAEPFVTVAIAKR